jgi:hypothetical protein
MLLFLAENMNSGRFGTFLGNTEQERKELQVHERTLSIFDAIEAGADFRNEAYAAVDGCLGEVEDVEPHQLTEWSAYFFHFTPYSKVTAGESLAEKLFSTTNA